MRLEPPVALVAALVPAVAALAQPPGALEVEHATLSTSAGVALDAVFHHLRVPANRNDPDSGTIGLRFARIRSLADDPRPPLVYLAGGPGGSSTQMAQSPQALQAWLPVLEVCDLVLLDQRGTGRSEPDMVVRFDDLPTDFFRDRASASRTLCAAAARAKQALLERGVDLGGFDSVQAADDVDDVRRALELERISLLGFSYGTHLAQVVMRRHGEHLECVILAGVEGLDQTYKLPVHMDTHLRRLALLARSDPAVSEDVADLEALCRRVLAKLEREPMVVSARHPLSGESVAVPVGAFGLSLILRLDIGDASDLPVFPRLLHSIEQGDPSILSWFVSKRLAMLASLSGMAALTDGASGLSEGRRALIREQVEDSPFGDACNFPWPDIAEAWGAHDLGDDYRRPLVSDVRTLLLSGTLDWNTPPFQAEQLRWGLTRATHVIVENAGHEQVLSHPEVQDAIVRFLAGEPVEGRTVMAPPLRFIPLHGSDLQRTHPSIR